MATKFSLTEVAAVSPTYCTLKLVGPILLRMGIVELRLAVVSPFWHITTLKVSNKGMLLFKGMLFFDGIVAVNTPAAVVVATSVVV